MKRVCIIAEAGVNHNGNIDIAKRLVDVAVQAGADYVKFQTFNSEKLASKYAEQAEYQKKNLNKEQSQLDMLKKLELRKEDYIKLKEYCKAKDIGFISTPFDLDSISFLETLDMDFWKIPSGEVTNRPYLEAIAHTGRKVIMSTGMCELEEITDAIEVLESNGTSDIVLLHCNTQYPTPFEDVNLSAMRQIKSTTKKEVGYSDHTVGVEVPIAAVALGATVIEKHFTLDRNMEGPDHKASLEPHELKVMVDAIRNIEKCVGDGIKRRTDSERKNCEIARKSIVAKCDISKGELLTEDNLTVKRPGSGISPMKWYEIIGTYAERDYKEDEII
ncbi:MAG: N-acetylneuraminate synthase [Agathobacter sp.]|nr:N-acetylneuraminate synthase [Agathobacter sp.]